MALPGPYLLAEKRQPDVYASPEEKYPPFLLNKIWQDRIRAGKRLNKTVLGKTIPGETVPADGFQDAGKGAGVCSYMS